MKQIATWTIALFLLPFVLLWNVAQWVTLWVLTRLVRVVPVPMGTRIVRFLVRWIGED